MSGIVRLADSKGRVRLPGFANATVVLEAVGPNEYRVRRAKVIPEDELGFDEEEMPLRLSARDTARFLKSLASPPKPNAAARKAAARFRKEYG